MSTLTRKGYARIYCEKPEDVPLVKNIVGELDSFELDYLPDDLITTFDSYPNLVYTGKFDSLDMNKLMATCWKAGIHVWVLDNGHSEFLTDFAP